MQAGSETQAAASYPQGIARTAPPHGRASGDLLIYKAIMALAGAALPVIAGVNWFLRGTISWPQLALAGVLLAGAALCWVLARAGRREVAAALLIGILWGATTIYAFNSGYGMHSAVIFIYLPCVLYTALFFGVTIATVELALTVAALATMYLAQENGKLGGAALIAEQGASFNFLLGVILTCVGTLVVSVVYHRRMERDTRRVAAEAEQHRGAMEEARLAQTQLETANTKLQALNDKLAAHNRRHELAAVRARRDFDLAYDVLTKDVPASVAALRAALATPDEQIEARLRGEIDRMEAVVSAIGELGGNGEPGLKREPVDLTALAHAMVKELRERPKYIRVTFQVEPGLRVAAEPELAAALLRHLIKRATSACCAELDPAVQVGSGSLEGRAMFFVRDNGPGIDEVELARLFRPFERGGMENTLDIGIVSARRIAERHGGELDVRSSRGAGTTFFFSLGA